MNPRTTPYLLVLPALLMVAVLVAALGILGTESFRPEPGAAPTSLFQYRRLLGDDYQMQLFATSFRVALLATLIATVLAYPVAWYVAHATPRMRTWVLGFLVLTFVSDYVLRMFGLVLVFGRNGLVNQMLMEFGLPRQRMMFNTTGVMIGMVASSLPYSILITAGVLGRIDRSQVAAARLLGAPPWRAFVAVTLPLSMPGVIAGAVIVFLLCLNSFIIPAMLGGGFVDMVATSVYEQGINLFNLPYGAAMSFLLLVLAMGLLAATNGALDRFGRRLGIVPARGR